MTTEGTTIAIDFGSTKIVTAYLNENDRATILIDDQTNRTMLNAIQFTENQCLVGNGADYGADVNVINTISGTDLKLLLTNNSLDNLSLMRTETMPLTAFLVDYQKQEERVHVVQLIAMLLAKVKDNAEDSLKTEIKKCIITVPTCYTSEQRLIMQEAGKLVEFEEVQIVDDTTAAALTYILDKRNIEDAHKILIVDVGATSTEAAIVLVEDSSITIQVSKGEINLGGNNFDTCLMKHFADEFKTKTGVDITGKQYELSTLRFSCIDLKKRLASVEKAKVTIQLFHNGQPYDLHLTRSEFEALCDGIYMRIMNVVKEVLDQTEKSDIEKVILIGGGSRLPRIQKEISSLMGGKELSRILNQDETTATGAAYYTLKKIDIQQVTEHDNDTDLKSGLNLAELRKFLLNVKNKDRAFIEYNSERVNLEALCYRFKRELKNRNLNDIDSKTILNKCNETLLWIKQSNYNNPTTTQMVREKTAELIQVNAMVVSQPEKKVVVKENAAELARANSHDFSQQEKKETEREKEAELIKFDDLNQPEEKEVEKTKGNSYVSNQPETSEMENAYDLSQPKKNETVKQKIVEPTKIDSDVTTQPMDVDNAELATTTQQNDLEIPVQQTETEPYGWIIPLPLGDDIVEININQEPMDTNPPRQIKVEQTLIQKILQKGLTFYHNGDFYLASNAFTEVLNSEDVQDINLVNVRAMRAYCYIRIAQFQLCIDDLNLIPRTARLQDIYDFAEHNLFQKKALKALQQCKERFESGGLTEQVCALTLITDALQNTPQNQSISNIGYTSQLLHAKAMYSFVLGHYTLAIFDIYKNMRLIHALPELNSQKQVMYKEVFEKMETCKRAMKKNMKYKEMQVQLKHVEKCLKDYGYSPGLLTTIFSNFF